MEVESKVGGGGGGGSAGAGAAVSDGCVNNDTLSDGGESKAGELYNINGVQAVKQQEQFRVYDAEETPAHVRDHYRLMRSNQCVEFVRQMEKKWHSFNKAEMTIREAFAELEGYVDCSDPDTTLPNVLHAFQTAEAARAAGEPDWLVLTAFIHDMGKIMYKWGRAEDGQQGTLTGPQWALGGDTWVVGVPIPECVVLPEFNALNPDHGKYTATGVYKPGCGMANLKFAYGHDEYMYRMLTHNKCALPPEALAIIRYHSCYPWHAHNAYADLQAPGDDELKQWVLRFNKYDLYSKAEVEPDAEALWPVYQRLIDKYCPGKLKW